MSEYSKYTQKELKEKIQQVQKNHADTDKVLFCPNHELEIYLYEYYSKNDDYELIAEPLHRMYYELALVCRKRNQSENMFEYLEKARQYNPADIDILTEIASEYVQLGDNEEALKILNEMYPYIYTKRDMSMYYSLLDSCYLAKYEPETAEVLAMYSKLFCENKQADKDLTYIASAVGRKHEKDTPGDLQTYISSKNIPVQPMSSTLGILYHTAKKQMADGNNAYAYQLFCALYQLTLDEEVGEILKTL